MTDNVHQRGFRVWGGLNGRLPPIPLRYRVASGYQGSENATNVDLCIGDPVKDLNSGCVAHADAGDAILGVVVGILPYYSSSVGAMVFGDRLPGGTAYTTLYERQSFVMVQPANGTIFEVDADDNTTATTYGGYFALINEQCDHVYTTGIEPKTDVNLDISTHNTTSYGWRILDISPSLANQDFSGANVKLLVTVNEGRLPPFSTSGV